MLQEEVEVECPFCGEFFTILVDLSAQSAGDLQTYIEDCFVCCRPIQFEVLCDEESILSVKTGRT